MIKTILIFLVLSSNAFAFGLLNQMDAVSTQSAGTCDCEDNTVDDDTTANGIYTTGTFYAQSFITAGSGTNVVVTLKAGSISGDSGTSAYTITVDDDWVLSDTPLGSASGTLAYNADNSEFCTVVTTTSGLSAGTYYFSVSTATATYGNRFYLRKSTGSDYADGKMRAENATTGLNFTSGTESNTDDLYFKVCVGTGCSCD